MGQYQSENTAVVQKRYPSNSGSTHRFHMSFFNLLASLIIIIFLASNLIIPSECISVAKLQNPNENLGMAIRTKYKLTCLSCKASRANNTCVPAFQKNITKSGLDYRCRVYERDGMVVAQGIVPSMLCTQKAKSMIRSHGSALLGSGRIYVGCCNSDVCNRGYCQAEGRNNTICNTTIGWKYQKPTTTARTVSTPSTDAVKAEQAKNGVEELIEVQTEKAIQNDDPNLEVEQFQISNHNKDSAKKSAPLKRDGEANAEAEPETAESKSEPEAEAHGGGIVLTMGNENLFVAFLMFSFAHLSTVFFNY